MKRPSLPLTWTLTRLSFDSEYSSRGTVSARVCSFSCERYTLAAQQACRESSKSCHRKQIAQLKLLIQTDAKMEREGRACEREGGGGGVRRQRAAREPARRRANKRYRTAKQRDSPAGGGKIRDGGSVKKRERQREAVSCPRQEVACDKSLH